MAKFHILVMLKLPFENRARLLKKGNSFSETERNNQ